MSEPKDDRIQIIAGQEYGPGAVFGTTKPGHCGHNYKIGACPTCWPVYPVRTAGGMHDDYEETHPAYAQIGASRVSSTGGRLYGSDFDHQHYMIVRINESSVNRGLSSDRYHAGKRLIEVAMSEAQWATFISTPNSGDGVPCTLDNVAGKTISRIPSPMETKADRFSKEMEDRLSGALERLKELRERLLAGKGGKESLSLLDRATQEIKSNVLFVTEQFEEHIEKTVESAKVEIASYLDVQTRRAGLEARKQDALPAREDCITLDSKELSKGGDNA